MQHTPRCDCRWALNTSGVSCFGADDGSPCWRRCCQPPLRNPRLLVVVQTHVVDDTMLERYQLAKSQLEEGGHSFHIAYLIGDGPADSCRRRTHPKYRQLQRVRDALGSYTVWCIDPPLYRKVFPHIFSQLREVPTRERYPKKGAVDGFNWAWTQCDLHALVGYFGRHEPRRFQPPDYLWVIDWDVAWTGNLHRILRGFDRTRADLLTFDEVKAERDDRSYLQQSLRNYLSDDEVRKALIVPARYSRRMLGATKQLVASGKHCFCETRGPSLCHASRWCTQRAMQTLRPDIFGEYHCCNDIPLERVEEMQQAWRRNASANRPPGQLLHRVRGKLGRLSVGR